MGGIDADLAVVPIVRMAGGAEHARRHGRGYFDVATAEQERIRATAGLFRFFYQQLGCVLCRAGDE